MAFTKTLIPSSILRGLQSLLAIVVLGLSVTLIKGHNPDHYKDLSGVPKLLFLAACIGGLTLAGAITGFVLACTEFLRGYFEVLIDIVVLLANLVGGVLIAIRLQGRNCADTSDRSRWGDQVEHFKNKGLEGIDILSGACNSGGCIYSTQAEAGHLNTRCKQSQADSVFMFLTVVVLFVALALTYLRIKKTY